MASLRELTAVELRDRLATLVGWRLVSSPVPGTGTANRVEIVKTFEFASFADAVRFMHEAVPQVDAMQHHPRWENVWRTLTISLSTWEIGHRPSELDLVLAAYFERHRAAFPPSRQRGAEP